jgi:hypothetical protein
MRKSLLNHHVVLRLTNEFEGIIYVLVIFEMYQYPSCVHRRSLSQHANDSLVCVELFSRSLLLRLPLLDGVVAECCFV